MFYTKGLKSFFLSFMNFLFGVLSFLLINRKNTIVNDKKTALVSKCLVLIVFEIIFKDYHYFLNMIKIFFFSFDNKF